MRKLALFVLISAAIIVGGCHKNKPPVARPAPPPAATPANRALVRRRRPSRSRNRPSCRRSRCVTMPSPWASLDELNRNSPLKPVFFELDSSDVDAEGQSVLNADAAMLKKYATLDRHDRRSLR